MSDPKDATIRSLAAALKEALVWSYVEQPAKPGPPYRVPSAIDHDLWKWREVKDKDEAVRVIREAIDRVVNPR